MKKLPVFMLAMMLAGIATAQTVIPRLGGTMAKVSLNEYNQYTNTFKPGFLIGAGYEIAITDLLAIQPELLFHQKGTKLKYSNGAAWAETIGLNYLELPVLVKLKFGMVYLNAGPYAAYGIGGKFKLQIGGDNYFTSKVKFGEDPADYSGADIYIDNSFDFGIAIGGGIVFLEKMEIGIRYNHGFADMNGISLPIPESNDDDTNTLMNRSIQLSVGYRLALKNK